jgi:hypothetical protein
MGARHMFILAHDRARQSAMQCVAAAPAGMVVKITEPTRSLEQNAKLHAMFGELEKKAKYLGRTLTLNQWKTLMISAHAEVTGMKPEVIPGIEGEYVNIRESSAQMNIARMTSLIEYIHAWAAEQGVQFKQDY